jgi:membrane protease subunit HflK
MSELPELKKPAPAAPAPPPMADDAGTQALSDALRSSFVIVKLLMIGLVVVFLGTGMFAVQPNEVAIILRFGKPLGEGSSQLLKPGWHWAFPAPVDEVVRIPIGQSHTLVSSVGWYATTPELEAAGKEPPARPSLQPGVDGYALTADGGTVHVKATLKYRITPASALDYTFTFTQVTNLLRAALDNAVLHAAAQFSADEILYLETARFRETLLKRLDDQVARLGLGVTMEPSEIKTSAPLAVKPAFEAVLVESQDRGRKISEAQGRADEITRGALAEANAIRNRASASSNQVVRAVSADAQYFQAQLASYRRDPVLFEERLLAETMQRVLTNAQDKFFLPARAAGQSRELRIQLNREPQKAPSPAAK